ncbi:MAG: hypothetical protein JNJ59_10170 [Deltaproteobacteria bacterium]|nr:hypothetical protein [Deltaproteobacteria bacterium]
MPSFRTLLDDGRALKEDLELLTGLARIARAWGEAAGQVADFPSLEALVDALVADVDDPKVVAAFEKLEAQGIRKRISSLLKEAAGGLDAIPADYRRLLTRVSKFDQTETLENPGLVDWKVLNAREAVPVGGPFRLDLAAEAALEFEAGDAWPFNDEMPDPLLRIKAGAKFGGKGEADAPFELGRVSGKAQGSGAFGLEYFYDVRSETGLYVTALAERVARLPQPFDFDAVWDAFAGHDLAGIIYRFEGGASAELGVNIATASLNLGAGIGAELGVAVDVAYGYRANYTLSLRAGAAAAGGGREIVATLTRNRAKSGSFGAALGLEVDVSSLTRRVHALLKEAYADLKDGLEKVQPFLTPGTWLQDKGGKLVSAAADALLGDGAFKAALVRDLRGALGVDAQDKAALSEWLTKELTAALDLSSILGSVEGRLERVLDRLTQRLPAFAEAEVRAKLAAGLKDLPGEAEKRLTADIAALVADSAAHRKLRAALKDAAAEVSGAASDLDGALAGVRKLVARYDKLLQSVVASAEDASKAQISARLELEESWSAEVTYQLKGVFHRRSDDARTVFEAITRGRLKAIRSLFADGATSDFELDPGFSSLKQVSTASSGRGCALVFLNFGSVSVGTLAKAKVTSGIDGHGNVVIDAEANFTATSKSWRESREASFVGVVDLALARADASGLRTQSRSVGIGLGVSHKDKSTRRKEVLGFVRSLEAARLLPPDTVKLAGEQFDLWKAPGSEDKLRVDLAAKLWLTHAQVATLMRLGGRPGGNLDEPSREAIVKAVLEGMSVAGYEPLMAKRLAVARKWFRPGAPANMTQAQVVLGFNTWFPKFDNDGPTDPEERHHIRELRPRLKGLLAFVDLIEIMGDVYESKPRGADAGGWTDEDYRKAQRQIAVKSGFWLSPEEPLEVLVGFGKGLDDRIVAALHAFTLLSGAATMSLTMTLRPKVGAAETVVLAR